MNKTRNQEPVTKEWLFNVLEEFCEEVQKEHMDKLAVKRARTLENLPELNEQEINRILFAFETDQFKEPIWSAFRLAFFISNEIGLENDSLDSLRKQFDLDL